MAKPTPDDAYLAGILDTIGNFQVRVSRNGDKLRLAIVDRERDLLEAVREIVGEQGNLYQSPGKLTWRLEYYHRRTVLDVIRRVRALLRNPVRAAQADAMAESIRVATKVK